jgi:hypothetical protein
MFFNLLSDQQYHHLTFSSTLTHPLMQQPSFETDNSLGGESGRPLNQSTFKVMVRWRYDENAIKLSQIVKKISQLDQIMIDEQAALTSTKTRFDELIDCKDKSAEKYLDLWGISPLNR